MTIKKKRKTAKKRKTVGRRKPQEILIVSEQPVNVRQTTLPPTGEKKGVIRATVDSIKLGIFYGMGIVFSLSPLLAHIVSQFYCGLGENARCAPFETHWSIELVGMISALAFANAARDVVSKSLKQIGEAAKSLAFLTKRSMTAENQAAPSQDK